MWSTELTGSVFFPCVIALFPKIFVGAEFFLRHIHRNIHKCDSTAPRLNHQNKWAWLSISASISSCSAMTYGEFFFDSSAVLK